MMRCPLDLDGLPVAGDQRVFVLKQVAGFLFEHSFGCQSLLVLLVDDGFDRLRRALRGRYGAAVCF